MCKLLVNYPCLKILQHCENCGMKELSETIIIADDYIKDFKFGEFLLKFVREKFSEEVQICKKCKLESKLTKEGTCFIMIDFDIVFQLNKKKFSDGIKINDIAEKINIKERNYMLGGIIVSYPSHFVTFNRQVNTPQNKFYRHSRTRQWNSNYKCKETQDSWN
ncbi:hypothetical protein PV328_003947 [Microctonus aethiopoides]|uniref:Uncharacterized protein n=1 Tax=Microctonus aethiopoides TaxID=144406 RepID=A0AA39F9I2_9HYME|nr:hypothetical protein PV328_003947 [Microctonus aethiopoides]